MCGSKSSHGTEKQWSYPRNKKPSNFWFFRCPSVCGLLSPPLIAAKASDYLLYSIYQAASLSIMDGQASAEQQAAIIQQVRLLCQLHSKQCLFFFSGAPLCVKASSRVHAYVRQFVPVLDRSITDAQPYPSPYSACVLVGGHV